MRVTSVESTALATVGYDEALELLQVEFRGRAIYRYFGVPAAVHQGLLGAPSAGDLGLRFTPPLMEWRLRLRVL